MPSLCVVRGKPSVFAIPLNDVTERPARSNQTNGYLEGILPLPLYGGPGIEDSNAQVGEMLPIAGDDRQIVL